MDRKPEQPSWVIPGAELMGEEQMRDPMAAGLAEPQEQAMNEGGSPVEVWGRRAESGLLKDARNMVTSLSLCSELLAEPGVLSPQYEHYARELELMVQSGRQLLEKIVSLDMTLFCRYAAVCEHYGNAPAQE